MRKKIFFSLTQPVWWRQQSWILLTESLMGLMAVLALTQGRSIMEVAFAFGALHLVSGLTFKWWHQTLVYSLLAVLAIICLLWFFGPLTPDLNPWWGWMLALGILMAIRDISAIQSMSKVDVVYRREGMNSFQQQKWSALWSIIFISIGLFVLSVLLSKHVNTAYVLLILGVVFGILPMLWGHHERVWWRSLKDLSWVHWYRRIQNQRALHVEKWRFFSEQARLDRSAQQKLLLDLSNLFHPIQVIGKRLILPVMIVIFVDAVGWEKGAISVMGALLGIMGLIVLFRKRSEEAFGAMWSGAFYSLLGWAVVGLSFMAMIKIHHGFVFLGVLGWMMVELSIRSWGAGFIENLRLMSGPKPHRRFYQRLLQKFFFGKIAANGFLFVAIGVVFAFGELFAAIMFLLMIGVAAILLWRIGHHRHSFLTLNTLNK